MNACARAPRPRPTPSASLALRTQVSKAALEDEDAAQEPDQTVILERRAFVKTSDENYASGEKDVKPEARVAAYRYGRDLIPVTMSDEDQLKFGVDEKCLQLLGFVRQEQVPRQYFMATPEAVVGDPDKPSAHRAIQVRHASAPSTALLSRQALIPPRPPLVRRSSQPSMKKKASASRATPRARAPRRVSCASGPRKSASGSARSPSRRRFVRTSGRRPPRRTARRRSSLRLWTRWSMRWS